MIPEFKIRSSASGDIMAGVVGASQSQLDNIAKMEAREKPMSAPMQTKYDKDIKARDEPAKLPAGARTYCRTWLKEKLYDRRKGFSSKYTDKGNVVEDHSVIFLNEYYLADMSKNEEFFQDAEIQGTPDLLPDEVSVWDIKNSWEPDTFPLFDTVPDKKYWWQLQCYMALTGRTKAKLVYTLMDAPAELIADEVRRASYKSNLSQEELLEYYTAQMTYKDIDTELRIKTFDFDIDLEAIKQIRERVALCREYIKTLIEGMK